MKHSPRLNIQLRAGQPTESYMPVSEHEGLLGALLHVGFKYHSARRIKGSGEPGWWLEAQFGPYRCDVYWHWAYAPSNWKRRPYLRFRPRDGVDLIAGPLTIISQNWLIKKQKEARRV